MPEAVPSPNILRFGVFELDLRAGELRKQGLKIRLQEKPLQILALLLEEPGQVVTREEIRQQLWSADTFVDFDHSVNTAINKLREALGDSAENPRFIETLPRHGYRFVAAVDSVAPDYDRRPLQNPPPEEPGTGAAPGEKGMKIVPGQPPADSASTAAAQPPTAIQASRQRRRWLALMTVAAVAAIGLFGTLFAFNVGGLRHHLLPSVGASHGVPFPKIQSIAVLPLENLSADPQQEYFADGMTEELITDLGKISALHVISRQSIMRYKGSKKPLPEIARELNVDTIVEGTVLRSGNRVRITANLLYAPTDRHMWAETYERDLRDVIALQNEVARAIAREVQAKLTPRERTGLARALPVNPLALDLYLKGRYHWNKRTPEALKKSLECFQQAIEKDPSYAPAHAGLADSYAMLGAGFYAVLPPRKAYPKAEAAATKALQLDNTLAQAHTTLAWSKAFFDWDWQGAEHEFKRAIELNPGYANAHHWYAAFLSIMGRHSEAISEDKKAESLDPLSLIISADVAMEALGPAGLYDQEMEQCRKTLEMDASFPLAHACLSDSYKHKRMYEEAVTEMLKAIDLSGGSVVWVSALAQIYALAGKRNEAMKILNELNARSKREYVSPDLFAYIYASLGDNDQAFAWIEKAYKERSNLVSGLKSGRQLDPLRSDPRYQDLLRRMNFPP